MTDNERQRFEAWASLYRLDVTPGVGESTYKYYGCEVAWAAWQAAIAGNQIEPQARTCDTQDQGQNMQTVIGRIHTDVATFAIGDPCKLLEQDGVAPITYDDYCEQSTSEVTVINGCLFVRVGADGSVPVYRHENGDIRIAVSERATT